MNRRTFLKLGALLGLGWLGKRDDKPPEAPLSDGGRWQDYRLQCSRCRKTAYPVEYRDAGPLLFGKLIFKCPNCGFIVEAPIMARHPWWESGAIV